MEDQNNNEINDSLVSELAGSFFKWGTIDDVNERNEVAKQDIKRIIESGNSKTEVIEVLNSKIDGMKKLIPSATKQGTPSHKVVDFYSNLVTDLTSPEATKWMKEKINPCENLTPAFYIEFLTVVDSNNPEKQKRLEDITQNLTPEEIECLKIVIGSFGKGIESNQGEDL